MKEPRYEGRPFLRLLELYVLWAIGRLEEKEQRMLEQMTPKLQQTFGHQGAWHEIIAAQMEFGPGAADSARQNWQRWQEFRRQTGGPEHPETFAREFADQLVNRQ
jgi:hypothetical protein